MHDECSSAVLLEVIISPENRKNKKQTSVAKMLLSDCQEVRTML